MEYVWNEQKMDTILSYKIMDLEVVEEKYEIKPLRRTLIDHFIYIWNQNSVNSVEVHGSHQPFETAEFGCCRGEVHSTSSRRKATKLIQVEMFSIAESHPFLLSLGR